jgi:CRP-like cAMP-binding protein
MDNIAECLSQAPVFSKLMPPQRRALADRAVVREFSKDEFVCWQGDIWPRVAYVAEGRLEWSMLSPEGRRQVVFELKPCEVVWGHSIVDGLPMPASLQVREPAVLYIWDKDQILPLILQSAEAAWDVSQVLVSYMRHVREVVYGFAFHPVAGRLARLLLARYGSREDIPAPRDLTLDQMAETVGTTRELVSRTLHRFADDGIIRVTRLEFVFTDRQRLEDLARQE